MDTYRNVILVCLDTVRKDFFDDVAVSLNDFADIHFEQCRAASSWSVPSHASLFTGELPHQHGVHTYNPRYDSISPENFLTSRLDIHSSINVTANVWLTRPFGINEFFDHQVEITPQQRFEKGLSIKEFNSESQKSGLAKQVDFIRTAVQHEHPIHSLGNGVFNKLLAYLKGLPVPTPTDDGATQIISRSLNCISATEEPFFLFQNFMDAHGPLHHVLGYDRDIYDVPLSWTSLDFDIWETILENKAKEHTEDIHNYRELYKAAIEYLDRKVSSFVRDVQKQTDRETSFIITADHGENLGFAEENNLLNHVSSLSEGLLHVPLLIINAPRNEQKVVKEYASHLQVPDIVEALSSGVIPEVSRDRVPAELIGGTHRVQEAAENRGNFTYWDRTQRCVYEGTVKYQWDSLKNERIFELEKDRMCWQRLQESNDNIPEWAYDFFDTSIYAYDRVTSNQQLSDALDESVQNRLSELGYL